MRQFKKNISRNLKVKKSNDEVIEAQLTEVTDEYITLEWKAREPKKIGKGKETVQKRLELPYTEIKEAVVTVTF